MKCDHGKLSATWIKCESCAEAEVAEALRRPAVARRLAAYWHPSEPVRSPVRGSKGG